MGDVLIAHFRLLALLPFLFSCPAFAIELNAALNEQVCSKTELETIPGTATTWGCYDPLPGHATAKEREEFVADIREAVISAERKYGVPAPALLAMALVESGAGFTRMPICSNNLFGWKWVGKQSAGQRDNFVLLCQPGWDANNRYIKFANRTESVDFVAMKLATLSAYKGDTERFKTDMREGGVDRRAAIRRWVEGISSPYNYAPTEYVKTILKTINDPITPSDALNPSRTLYTLKAENADLPNVSTETSSQNATLIDVTALEKDVAQDIRNRFAKGGRYVVGTETSSVPHKNCKLPSADALSNELVKPYAVLKGSDQAQLLECVHPSDEKDGREGWTIILAATPENIARRIVRACARAKPQDPASCSRMLLSATDYRAPWSSNNFIFPITGFVFEGSENCKNGSGRTGLIGFRHGVTVQYANSTKRIEKFAYCSDALPIDMQRNMGLTFATWEVFSKGRIAALDRGDVPGKLFPKKDVENLDLDSFQLFVRNNEIRAIQTGDDEMMNLKAASFK